VINRLRHGEKDERRSSIIVLNFRTSSSCWEFNYFLYYLQVIDVKIKGKEMRQLFRRFDYILMKIDEMMITVYWSDSTKF
jgi:hypothetical protein